MSVLRRFASPLAGAAVIGSAYLFIYLPVGVLVLFSFHAGKVPVPPFEGPSFDWYVKVFGNARLTAGTLHSLMVGILSSAVATALGFFAAYGFARHTVPGRRWLEALIVAPLTVSYLIVGVGLLITFNALDVPKSLFAAGVGHVVINLPLCFAIIQSQMGAHQAVLERAARDLGAAESQVLRRVTLPLLWPALFAAFCLSFTLSWDEFVISFLLTDFEVTLPVVIWSMLRTGLNPETNAAGTLVFLVSLVLVLTFEALIFRRRP